MWRWNNNILKEELVGERSCEHLGQGKTPKQANNKPTRFSQRLKVTPRCCIWVAHNCAPDPKTRLVTHLSHGTEVFSKIQGCEDSARVQDLCLSEWRNQLKNSHCRGLECLHSFYPWSLLFWAMTCFSSTPTQCSSVRLLVLFSTVSRDHLEMALKGVGKESFFSCKSLRLTLTQLSSGKGRQRSGASNSWPTLVRLLQHLHLQVMEVIWGRGRTQMICQTH